MLQLAVVKGFKPWSAMPSVGEAKEAVEGVKKNV
jgi:hypothetical protein